jgi:hypothetical protein
MVMFTLDICNKEKMVSGKWGNSYTFTSYFENNRLTMVLKNNSGTVIAKWEGNWIIQPHTPKEKKAARDILEFLYYRNSVSYWMKTIG